MQANEFHFLATAAVCKEVGLTDEVTKVISWANCQTDHCTAVFGFHTQNNAINLFWSRAGTCFHFLPGDGADRLVTTPNCSIARKLIAMNTNGVSVTDLEAAVGIGMALHGLQDSFAHRLFSGRRSRSNNTQPWMKRFFKPFGHITALKSPDICSAAWYDGRLADTQVVNRSRFARALKATHMALGGDEGGYILGSETVKVLDEPDYEKRKRRWSELAGMRGLRFSQIRAEYWKEYGGVFKAAAKRQKAFVLSELKKG